MKRSGLGIIWAAALAGAAAVAPAQAQETPDAELVYPPPYECWSEDSGIRHGEARGEDWFIAGEPIEIGGRRYAKFGLPRVLAASELEGFASYRQAGVFTAPNAGTAPEIVYVLLGAVSAASKECEYQPYAIDQ